MLPTPKNGIFACVCVLLLFVSPFYYFDFYVCCLAVNSLYNNCSRRKSCSVAPPLDPPRKSKGIASRKVRLWYTTEKQNQIKTKKQWRKDFFSDVGKIPSPSTSVSAVIVKIVLNSGVYKKRKHSCVLFVRCVFSSLSPSSSSSSPSSLLVHYAIRIDWMIWKMAEPHTTKMNSASSHGPTGYFSSAALFDLGTLPRWVMLRLAFSLAMRILCCGAIAVLCW